MNARARARHSACNNREFPMRALRRKTFLIGRSGKRKCLVSRVSRREEVCLSRKLVRDNFIFRVTHREVLRMCTTVSQRYTCQMVMIF